MDTKVKPAPGGNREAGLNDASDTSNHTPSASADQQVALCSGFGQYHTNEADPDKPLKKLTQYVGITFDEIRALVDNPQQVDKKKAQWVIPSTVMSRTFKVQEQEGEYRFLWADLDKDAPPLDALVEMFRDYSFEIYTSRSATRENPKSRILLPISKPLCCPDWKLCQKILNDELASAGIEPDKASEGAAQLCYLPNRGEFYDSRSQRNVDSFDPLFAWGDEIAIRRQKTADKVRELVVLKNEAVKRRAALRSSDAPDTIGAFNLAYSVQELLLKAGYDQDGATFRHPHSESGSYSASVKDGRVHSLSSNDPLYTGGGGVGAHDAFSVFTVLWCGGEQSDALKLAGDEWLMIGAEPWNKVKQREFAQKQPQAKFPEVSAETDVAALFDDLVLSSEDVKKMADADFLIPDMIVRGHIGAYVSPANGGKTTIFIYLCEALAADGLKVLYINVDGSPGDLKRHYSHAEKYGYKVIAPDAKDGKSTEDVLQILRAIAKGAARCDDLVLIIDTLKKFVDVINKTHAKGFYTLLRAITVKGATICLLGHTNKYKDEDGKSIFEGTADLRNDLDELIYLDSFKDEVANTLAVTTRPDKVRAEFSPRTYIINLDDRGVTEAESVINILSKDDRELLDKIKAAITSGKSNQKEIIDAVKAETIFGDKKIREAVIRHSNGPTAEIQVEATGRGKDLRYSVRNSFAGLPSWLSSDHGTSISSEGCGA
jgi:hypothetical protein